MRDCEREHTLSGDRWKPMADDIQPEEQADRLSLPWDLSEWVDKDLLVRWIADEIQTLDWANPELVEHLAAHPNYHPKMMLSVVTYGYATGVFESEEIVRACYGDPVFRSICLEAVPTAKTIARFRRDNRGLFKWSLAQVFRRALKAKYSLGGEVLLPVGLRRYLVDAAIARIDLARHMDRSVEGA
jgi:transposase